MSRLRSTPSSPRLPEALALLQQNARPGALAGMVRFAMQGEGRLGVSIPTLRRMPRTLRADHALAQSLWDTAIPDARILAGMVAQSELFTPQQMDTWAQGFASWDVCDQVCGNAFCASPLAWSKVEEWAQRPEEFVRRAAFAMLATLAVHDKRATNARFIAALAWVEAAAHDERNFVKKAVNWALRNIGKRNTVLHAVAIAAAQRIQQQGGKSARWIAADALRELRSESVQWTVDEMALRLLCSPTTCRALETGKPGTSVGVLAQRGNVASGEFAYGSQYLRRDNAQSAQPQPFAIAASGIRAARAPSARRRGHAIDV